MTTTLTLGAPAPDFTLTDHTGRTRRLADFHGQQHVVLVFNRGLM